MIKNCIHCNKEIYVKPNHHARGWGKYCSKKCQAIYQYTTGQYYECGTCNNKVWRAPARKKKTKSGLFFCNKSCAAIYKNKDLHGNTHPCWNGGKSTYREKMIKSREEQICSNCKNTDTRILIVHHIDQNRNNNELPNLTWLCRNCHWLVHNYK